MLKQVKDSKKKNCTKLQKEEQQEEINEDEKKSKNKVRKSVTNNCR